MTAPCPMVLKSSVQLGLSRRAALHATAVFSFSDPIRRFFLSRQADLYKGQPRTSTDLESAPDIDLNQSLEPRVAASFVVPQASRGAARMTTTPFVRMSFPPGASRSHRSVSPEHQVDVFEQFLEPLTRSGCQGR